jgi:UV DNA damage repair endonuclease
MNGHVFDPDKLHKEGCDFGQKQAIHMEYLVEMVKEIKTSMEIKDKEDKAKFAELTNKVELIKEDVIREVTKSETDRKFQSGLISFIVSLAVAFIKPNIQK